RKDELLHGRSGLADRIQLAHQWVGGIDFVVPVGADHQQVPHVGLGQQILNHIECRSIEPLQIVEKKGEGMFRPRKYTDESAEYQLEPALRVLWRKFRDGWLFSDDELQFRDEIHNQPSVRI